MSRSGLIRRKAVNLYRKETTRNDFGERVPVWSNVRSLRSYPIKKSGKYSSSENEDIDIDKIRIKLRAQYDIRNQDRLQYMGNMYQIDVIRETDIEGRWLEIRGTRINE